MSANQVRQANRERYKFLHQRGINDDDISRHPQADDVVLLVAIKDSFHSKMTPNELGKWAALWDKVYYKKKPLRQNVLRAFEQLIQNIEIREQEKQQKHRDQLRRIQAIRHQVKTTI